MKYSTILIAIKPALHQFSPSPIREESVTTSDVICILNAEKLIFYRLTIIEYVANGSLVNVLIVIIVDQKNYAKRIPMEN